MYINPNQWGISRLTNNPTDDQILFNKYKYIPSKIFNFLKNKMHAS